MKNNYQLTLFSLLGTFLLLFTSGCDKNNDKLYLVYDPIYANSTAVLSSINGDASKSIDTAGKIYVQGSYIFVSEPDKGVHVIDNRNPLHPLQTAFLSIPGNQDIAVKGNTLYADMYSSLLAIDITDVHHVRITNQLANFFTERVAVNGFVTIGDKIIVGWVKRYSKTQPLNSGGICPNCAIFANAFAAASSSSTGTGGSMAKMVLLGDHLYALSERHSLQVVNLENPSQPALGTNIFAGFDLETIYPFSNKLFLGSAEGVFIYDISDPANPVASGKFTHGRACDPVITDGDYAYVTLHAGTSCGGDANELDVVNVKDLSNPVLVKTLLMNNPMGLTKDGSLLFVCDGPGVKVYDASNPAALQLRNTLDAGNAYDVISSGKRLLVASDKGLYQYDYSKPNMPMLSMLRLTNR